TADSAALGVLLRHHHVAVLAGERRNPMTPPELTGNAPVTNVFHPGEEGFVPVLRAKADASAPHRFDCRTGERCDFHKPLVRQVGFDHILGSLAGPERDLVRLASDEPTLLFQPLDHPLAGLESIETREFTGFLRHLAVGPDHDDRGKLMPLA